MRYIFVVQLLVETGVCLIDTAARHSKTFPPAQGSHAGGFLLTGRYIEVLGETFTVLTHLMHPQECGGR